MSNNDINRLGRNRGGYFGQRIDIRQLLGEARGFAEDSGWAVDELPVGQGRDMLAFRRGGPTGARKVYLSTGIHGDEPAGPLAMHQLLKENQWPEHVDLWICPCLNPLGFERNSRENADGVDLNRDYRSVQTTEVRAHIDWLEKQPLFDLSLCLHEDWESHGFYVYELDRNGNPALAPRIIEAVEKVCPIDLSPEIEGRPAQGGIINPDIDPKERPEWPEAFYLIEHKSPQSCTLEAPSDFALEVRVRALVRGTRAALEAC